MNAAELQALAKAVAEGRRPHGLPEGVGVVVVCINNRTRSVGWIATVPTSEVTLALSAVVTDTAH